MRASVEWRGGETFVGRTGEGHEVSFDGAGRGAAASPTDVLLLAFGACDGISVVGLLGKMRQEVTAYHLHLAGEQRDEHPRIFTKIHLEHVVRGPNLDAERVHRAVDLATRYCPVGATLRLAAEVTETVTIQQEDAPRAPSPTARGP